METHDPGRPVEQTIREILADHSLRGERLVAAIGSLAGPACAEPFRATLRIIAPLDRPEGQARVLFEGIDRQRLAIEERLGRDPGWSVAALHHLHDVEGVLREPGFDEEAPAGGPPARAAAPDGGVPLEELLSLELRRAERFGRPAALVLLAPDRPPRDGEAALRSASDVLRGGVRDTDQVARVVPDGFALLLPCTGGDTAILAARRLCAALRGPTGVAWSAGVAACPADAHRAAALALCARRALEVARLRGGDRVETHQPERREHPRRSASAALTGRLSKDGRETAIIVEDLSLGGALLRTRERLEPGCECLLTLRETSARPREVSVPTRVVRAVASSSPGGAGEWMEAVVFLSGAEGRVRVAALLADLHEPPCSAAGAGARP